MLTWHLVSKLFPGIQKNSRIFYLIKFCLFVYMFIHYFASVYAVLVLCYSAILLLSKSWIKDFLKGNIEFYIASFLYFNNVSIS